MNTPSGDPRPPLAVAMEWVSQITTVVAEMVLPGLAGEWLDDRWGSSYLALVGFALGLTVGIWHLITMTRPRSRNSPTIKPQADDGTKSEKMPRPATDPDKKQD
jgi:hypothetical protein